MKRLSVLEHVVIVGGTKEDKDAGQVYNEKGYTRRMSELANPIDGGARLSKEEADYLHMLDKSMKESEHKPA